MEHEQDTQMQESAFKSLGDNKVMNTGKGDWCIVSIDGNDVRAKIVHRGRGKYRIVEDNMDGKYLTTTMDAEDVVRVE